MELELGLGLPNRTGLDLICARKKSRGFVDEEEVESKGSSLLLWSGHNDDDDRNSKNLRRLHVNDEETNNEEIDGWPPINSLRREFLRRRHRLPVRAAVIRRRSMYVKVKMEGVLIGRKIDLGLVDSYKALTDTLIKMFGRCKNGDYTILYQDKEGDWMLVEEDASWESFVESVQRIEMVRKNE